MADATRDRWHPYEAAEPSSVTGTILRSDPLEAESLGRTVELTAWIPPSGSDSSGVLFMHDGHNLFDEGTSYAGEWHVDEVLTELGLDVVVVGIPNAGDARRIEYAPWPTHLHTDVLGAAYAEFVAIEVVPFVRRTLPVTTDRDRTGVMGSSLGGLISIYLSMVRPDLFGLVGSMSTAAWWTPSIWSELEQRAPTPGRVYLDVGTNEIPDDSGASAAYTSDFRRLEAWYRSSPDVELLAVQEDGAIHHETAWARRLPAALRFLFR